MRAAIIDASIAVKWVLPEPYSEQARTLLGALTMYAPAHWQAEAVNGVWKRVHRGQLSAHDARECASVLTDAPIGVVPLPRLMERAFDRAMGLRITVYDGLYLALAEARGLPLISDDRELLRRIKTDPALAPLALHVGEFTPP